MPKKHNELEIATAIIAWLTDNGWDVYQEVQPRQFSRRADIVALKDEKVWVIETKTSLGLYVIAQAYYWNVDYRSVGVPGGKRADDVSRGFAKIILRKFNMGLFEVKQMFSNYVLTAHNVIEPKQNEHLFDKSVILGALTDEHKYLLPAGSKGGGYVTEYRLSIEKVKEFIKNNPGTTMLEITNALGKLHYSNIYSARNSLTTALLNWERDWCRNEFDVDKGIIFFSKEQTDE